MLRAFQYSDQKFATLYTPPLQARTAGLPAVRTFRYHRSGKACCVPAVLVGHYAQARLPPLAYQVRFGSRSQKPAKRLGFPFRMVKACCGDAMHAITTLHYRATGGRLKSEQAEPLPLVFTHTALYQ